MKDENKTKKQLISELVSLRQRITELERREDEQNCLKEEMFKSETRFKCFIQNFQGIAFQGKLDFTPLFFKGAVSEITGYSEDNFLQGNPRWDHIIHPDDLPNISKSIEDVHSTPCYSTEREYRIIRNDGQTRWVHEFIQNICNESGEPILVQGAIYDITEKKQTEASLKKAEQKFRELYENLRDGMASVDMSGRITEFNAAFQKMLGYESEEIFRLTYKDISPKKWHIMEEQILKEQVLERGYSDLYEKEYIRKDGTVFPVELRTYLIRNEDGLPWGMWACVRDIASRKKIEKAVIDHGEELKRKIKELEDFYDMAVGRELRMKQLKEELEYLREELDKYKKAAKNTF